MKERLSLKRKKYFPPTLLATVALFGCGGNNYNAAHFSLNTCGNKDYNKPVGESVESISNVVNKAKADVLILQSRALSANGSINLPRYSHVTEIEALKDELNINFERSNLWGGNNRNEHGATDTVFFHIKDGSPEISKGAVVCIGKDGLYANGTFQALKQYVTQTAVVEK